MSDGDAPWKLGHIPASATDAEHWGVPTLANLRVYEVLLDDETWVARVKWIDDNVWHEAYLPESLLVYEDVRDEWNREQQRERDEQYRRQGRLREQWDELCTHRPVRWKDVPPELASEAYERFHIENQCHAAVANTYFYTFHRCSRTAVDGSPYCTVHRRIARGETSATTKRSRRTQLRRDARQRPHTPESFWWNERYGNQERESRGDELQEFRHQLREIAAMLKEVQDAFAKAGLGEALVAALVLDSYRQMQSSAQHEAMLRFMGSILGEEEDE
jgi:hypothetical protein